MGNPERERKPFRKVAKKEAIVFDVKKRFEYLNGFSKRKAERKIRGNRTNMKKELKMKKIELDTYKRHVQKEFEKAQHAVRHNYGEAENSEEVAQDKNVIEDQTHFYPGQVSDPFGDVSIQITSLESPEFISVMDSSRAELLGSTKSPAAPPKKKTPTFAKFKHMTKSRKFIDNHRAQKSKKSSQGLKKVKATVKKTKKPKKRFNR